MATSAVEERALEAFAQSNILNLWSIKSLEGRRRLPQIAQGIPIKHRRGLILSLPHPKSPLSEETEQWLTRYISENTTLECIEIRNIGINFTYDGPIAPIIKAAADNGSIKRFYIDPSGDLTSPINFDGELEPVAELKLVRLTSDFDGQQLAPLLANSRFTDVTLVGQRVDGALKIVLERAAKIGNESTLERLVLKEEDPPSELYRLLDFHLPKVKTVTVLRISLGRNWPNADLDILSGAIVKNFSLKGIMLDADSSVDRRGDLPKFESLKSFVPRRNEYMTNDWIKTKCDLHKHLALYHVPTMDLYASQSPFYYMRTYRDHKEMYSRYNLSIIFSILNANAGTVRQLLPKDTTASRKFST